MHTIRRHVVQLFKDYLEKLHTRAQENPPPPHSSEVDSACAPPARCDTMRRRSTSTKDEQGRVQFVFESYKQSAPFFTARVQFNVC